MNLDKEIRDLHAELYAKGTIPCVLAGRNVRDTECCSLGLAANAEDFRRCLSCKRGHELAATSPFGLRGVLPVVEPPVYCDDRPRQIRPMPTMLARIIAPRPVVPAAKPAPVAKRAAKAPRPKRQAQPKPAPGPVAAPAALVKAAPEPKPQVKCRECGRLRHFNSRWPELDLCHDCGLAQAEPKPQVKCRKCCRPRHHLNKWPEPDLCHGCGRAQAAPKPAYKAAPAKPQAKCRECGWPRPLNGKWPEQDLCNDCGRAQAAPPAPIAPAAAPAPVEVAEAQPVAPALPYSLVKLAAVLRELTSDGRLRVTMLDIQRALRAPTYDAAAALVMQARLRTSRLVGPVETVIVDNTMRELLARAQSCEVLQ